MARSAGGGLPTRTPVHPLTAYLCPRVPAWHPGPPYLGLPIGAHPSHPFTNPRSPQVHSLVRPTYNLRRSVDDPTRLRETLAAVRSWTREIKPQASIGQGQRGVSFLGFRVWPGCQGLGSRRRRRYIEARARWEARFRLGEIDAFGLQQGITAALAITAHADAAGWRRGELDRRPPVDA